MPENALVDWLRDSEPGPLDDEQPPPRSRRASGVIAVLGGLWLGLLVVAWQAFGAPAAEPGAEPAADFVEPLAAAPAPPALPAPEPAGAPHDERVVTAHAVLAVRAATVAPTEDQRRYVDLAVAEKVHWTPGAAVVTVLAYLLEGDEHRWSSARTARYGVALSQDGDTVRTEAVWPLPAPDPGPARDWDRLTDTALAEAARSALEAAGYDGIGAVDLATHTQLPGVLHVTVDATAPGESHARTHHVWVDSASADVLGWGG